MLSMAERASVIVVLVSVESDMLVMVFWRICTREALVDDSGWITGGRTGIEA